MREQSHKDEMSRALRGDFERLRGRGVATTLGPRGDAVVSEDTDVDPEPELAPEIEEPVADLRISEPPAFAPSVPEPDPEPDVEPVGDDVATSTPGFFSRLIGR